MNQAIQKRDSSLDLVRILAAFLVISIHTLYQNGFYELAVAGRRMYLLCVLRQLFATCVPLFLLLTGYLMGRKTLTKAYYRGVLHTLEIYLLASLVTIVFRMIYKQESFTVKSAVLGMLNYSNAPYAWYIEMYLGLFLLIPFLNLIYRGLETKAQKQWLVATMLLLCALPGATNIFALSENGWWRHPITATGTGQILPDFWTDLYPVMYYFLGCYLREFRCPFRARTLALLLGVQVVGIGTLTYLRNYGAVFLWGSWTDWGSLFNVVTAVLLFRLVTSIDTSGWSGRVKEGVRYLAGLSLGTYLVSWIFDRIFYDIALDRIADPYLRQNWNLLLAIAVFLCATGLSALLNAVGFRRKA